MTANGTLRHATETEKQIIFKAIERTVVPLYGNAYPTSLLSALLKAEDTPGNQASAIGITGQIVNPGLKPHPFDFEKVKALQLTSEHHATCIHTKVACTVGLGFLNHNELQARERALQDKLNPPKPQAQPQTREQVLAKIGASWQLSKCDEVLNPLCDNTWQETISQVVEDYWQTAHGYIEVVRDKPTKDAKIIGIHWIPSENVRVVVESAAHKHFEVQSEGGTPQKFAKFGDLEGFISRRSTGAQNFAGSFIGEPERGTQVSEIIQFRRPCTINRWYAFPDWISAVAAIELIQCLRQHRYDFFNNRGVPEFMLFIMGQKLSDEDWKTVTDSLHSNVGRGNSHKSFALNLVNPEIKVQLEKLAIEGNNDAALDSTNETYQLAIVSAHGVPPLLAGIVIPGRLGSNNELPNSLQGFQVLRVQPTQNIIRQTLGATLGNQTRGGVSGLTPDDFIPRTITDEIDFASMSTVAGMRQPLTQANAQGRNLKAGFKQ